MPNNLDKERKTAMTNHLLLERIRDNAKAANKHIVLPEGTEPRTIAAASIITKEKIARITLLGDIDQIKACAAENNVDLSGIELLDPLQSDLFERFAVDFAKLREKKGITLEKARETIKHPLYFGAMMVQEDFADGMVAGAKNSTSDVLRPALQIIKTARGVSTACGAFFIFSPQTQYGEDGAFIFADCGVNPTLTPEQMADVAYCCHKTAIDIIGIKQPRIAMLSFSTKGSAQHETVDKVRQAVEITHERYPELIVDGELQLDAAIVPRVGELKAPDSPVAGHANILIFPDLQSGNICYKATQYFGNAIALGPILVGMAKPVNDLSRGCSVEDIVNIVAIVCCQQPDK